MSAFNHRCKQRDTEPLYRATCSAPKCNNAPLFVCRYDYITGRAGRVSSADKDYCFLHAQRFCEKYGIDFVSVERETFTKATAKAE